MLSRMRYVYGIPVLLKGQKACRFSYFHLTVYYTRGPWGMILYEWAILYFQNCNEHILATRAALFSKTQESVRPAKIFQSLPHTFEARRLSASTEDFSLYTSFFFPFPTRHARCTGYGRLSTEKSIVGLKKMRKFETKWLPTIHEVCAPYRIQFVSFHLA